LEIGSGTGLKQLTDRRTICATVLLMSRSLHVRLDDSSTAALNVIRGDGLSDSEAVRTALREAAARRRVRSSIAAEVQRLAADELDRAEMRAVREQMAELAPEVT
jgi:Arc/MetJ-type ribon-helix-helix transcriptional regulator